MKKIKYLLMLCIFTIISTGCVKYNANMEIKKDKSMDFTIDVLSIMLTWK